MVTLQAVRERLRTSLWFVPALFALAAIGAALVLLAVDETLATDDPAFFLYGGTAEGARSVLSAIAQSMLTFTGLVFTITMLVLQLASSQLSPRVMRTFLRDRANQVVLGLFVATFVFTLVVLRDVRTPVDGNDGFVPGISIWVAFVLLLASVGAFVYYIDHMAHAIRASTVVANIAAETHEAIDRLYPDALSATGATDGEADAVRPADRVLPAPRGGVVVGVDDDVLTTLATKRDRQLEMVPAIGDFVPSGGPLLRLVGDWDDEALADAGDAIELGDERTVAQDAAFGFRQLVDVAIRALSPGTNDPTTAVQALDRLHDLLRHLAEREIPSALRQDDSGRVVLVLPRPGWDDYVALAVDEIRLAGAGQIQIARRLRYLLEDLLSVAGPARQAILRRELGLVAASAERSFADAADAAVAQSGSARGHADDTATPRPGDVAG
jgi:uncharacterized membrane protein